jgi:Fe-S-cluster containining protein
MPQAQIECIRCGTCCLKGGPALHHDDQKLILQNKIQLEHLVTIRKGEPVESPLDDSLEYLQTEIIKLKGQANDWACLFFDRQNASCLIYQHRPLECTLLKCWDTDDLEQIISKDLICRTDIITDNNPVLEHIAMHEKECSLAGLSSLISSLPVKSLQDEVMTKLTDLVQKDLAIRAQALASPYFPEKIELFAFGRPLFLILNNFGIVVQEVGGTLILQYSPKK